MKRKRTIGIGEVVCPYCGAGNLDDYLSNAGTMRCQNTHCAREFEYRLQGVDKYWNGYAI